MTHYIETYVIPGTPTLGIEDHEDGRPAKDHFFHDEYKKGKRKRFNGWWNGGGIGGHGTLSAARRNVFEFAVDTLTKKRNRLKAELAEADESLAKLGDDVFNLGRFRA